MTAPAPSLPPPLPPGFDRDIDSVFYADKWAKQPFRTRGPWRRLVSLVTEFVETSPCTVAHGPNQCKGKKCPYKSHSTIPNNPMAWSPVRIEGKRLDRNVLAITVLVLDLDHVTQAQADFVEARLAGTEHCFHSTHNHRGGDDQCLRQVIALSRDVPAAQWSRFLPAAIDYLRVGITTVDKKGKVQRQPDPVCKNRDRMYFRPSHPKDAPFTVGHVRGQPLDVDAVLAYAETMPPPPTPKHDRPRLLPEAVDWDLDGEPVLNAIDAIARYMPDTRRHEFALALGGMLRAHGATEEDAHYILFEGFTAGGSEDPDARAKTTEHTYALDEEAAMTGFTRVADIIGDEEARELGDYFRKARDAEFLRRLGSVDGYEIPSLTSTAIVPAPSLPPALPGEMQPPRLSTPAASVSIAEVRSEIMQLARRRAGGSERDEQIMAVLLRRLLSGEPLARPGGYGDVETVLDGKDRGIGRDLAVRKVFASVGRALPQLVPWHQAAETALWAAMKEVARGSLAQMEPRQGASWLVLAEQVFQSARLDRLDDEVKRGAAAAAQREHIRQQYVDDGGAGGVEAGASSQGDAGGPPALAPPPAPVDELEDEEAIPLSQRPKPPGWKWEDEVTRNPAGQMEQKASNATALFRYHPDFAGFVRWNEVRKRVEVTGGPLRRFSKFGTNAVAVGASDYLSSVFGLAIDEAKVGRRLTLVARENPYDPIKNYLAGLRWDGVERIETWLSTYCGATETNENREFLRKVGRRWLVALVARGIKVSGSRSPSGPGCKVDNVLVLEGAGGMGKSTVFQIIGGEWFCDTAIDLGDKDSRMMASQYWICELAELVQFKRGSHESLKNFFSSNIDKFRPPYGSEIEECPRRCLFVGTTNEDHYLGDETGNRKYWTVYCIYTEEAIAALRRDRDQLLAEAVVALRNGEKWWFDFNEIGITEAEAEARMVEKPIAMKLRSWWYGMAKSERPTSFTSMEAVEQALDALPAQIKAGDLQSAGAALKKMGFKKRRDTSGPRVNRYYPSKELLEAERVEPKRRGLFAIQGGKKDEPPPLPSKS